MGTWKAIRSPAPTSSPSSGVTARSRQSTWAPSRRSQAAGDASPNGWRPQSEGGVGVVDLEPALGRCFEVVDRGPLERGGAGGIDQQGDAARVDHVMGGLALLRAAESEPVLESPRPAPVDGEPQRQALGPF